MFADLKQQVKANFEKLATTGSLFYVDIDRDLIFEKYLEGFSEETRQGHNCNCCKSFLRQYSGVVGIVDNTRISIWDNIVVEEEYIQSIENIRTYIASLPITNVFLVTELNCGVDKNRDRERDIVWEHFHFVAPRNLKVRKEDFDTIRSAKRTCKDTLKRALTELSMEAVDTVLELIDQDSLYRGASFKPSVQGFKKILAEYQTIEEDKKENFIWVQSNSNPQHVSGFRNTSIGTLVVDLSEGKELDIAVASFENKVSGTNYKRPKPLVTQKMIEDAKQKIESLGLTASLERRYAKPTDLNIKDILYTDNSSSISDVFQDLSKDVVVSPRSFSKVEEINIKDFISKVLPTVKSAELLMEDSHRGNLVTLVTGENSESPSLFPWNNNFSWSYAGGITDSIKERVKAAGGGVEGVLRASLSWSNYDDLDIHMKIPNQEHIYYGNRRGLLDVDMNAGGSRSKEPVENIIFKNAAPEGSYYLWVENFCKREHTNVGYTVQIECNGEIYEFHYDDNNCSMSNIIKFTYSIKDGIKFTEDVQQAQGKTTSKTYWGVKTNTFTKIKKILLSPNHWGDKAIGNKHYMFFLEGCEAEEQPRGFFNEFLKPEFNENRRVFELLGGKVPVYKDGGELSGLGFSETLRNHIFVKVKGTFERVLKVVF